MGTGSRKLMATASFVLVLVQNTSYTKVAASSILPAPIASVLADSGYIPRALVEPAATLIASAANTAQSDLTKALSRAGIDARKQLEPELYYSYGHSPPVYPSPQGTGNVAWAEAYRQAKELVSQMSNEEKNVILTPAVNFVGCSGFTGSIPRLNFSGMCLNDAESGVRTSEHENVSGYPALSTVGATWDRGLAYLRGKYLGAEFKAKGVNVALGPVIGPLGRVAKGGRNWEGFSNDPYLAGSLVDPTVRGMQQSVIACVKHFIAYEQETNRNPFFQGFLSQLGINLNNSVSSNVDDRTMHELYLWPFYDAVKAGAGSVMASYNRVNNSYVSQNSKMLNGLLKMELGFQGFVVSDWYGQHTGIASANAGLDLVMPTGTWWGSNQLATAVRNGSVSSTRLDDMAVRVLASWLLYAPFETPGIAANSGTNARTAAASQIIFQAAVEGHVMVKNTQNALPLKAPKTLSIFGYDAISGYNTSSSGSSLYSSGLANTREYTNGQMFGDLQYLVIAGSIMQGSVPEVAFNGTMITGGGSGAITPSYTVSPLDALQREAALDGTLLHTDFVSQDPTVHPSDACLVFINAQSSEAADRSTLADVWSDTLVLNVAAKCNNTMVVIHNAGVRLVDRWIDHPNITAVIFAHLPGQASGSALVEVLYGRQSPSGRLPYTVAKNESDYGVLLDPTLPDVQNPQYPQSNFDEGVFIDYRHFMQRNITPRFAFGHGLTYTTFTYSNLSISKAWDPDCSFAPPDKDHTPPEGGLTSLYDIVATVSVSVKNSGSRAAAEVAQLYLGIPNSGVSRALRGFEKHWLRPGESMQYTFPLRRRDISLWDTSMQQWMIQKGEYQVIVGKSVLDGQLEGAFAF